MDLLDMRYKIQLFSLLTIVFLAGSVPVSVAQTNGATDAVTVVLPITLKAGKSRADAMKLIKGTIEIIRSQPGLVDETLMENKSSTGTPTFVHIMRWREIKDFEAMTSNKEFLSSIAKNNGHYTVDLVKLYLPVKS
jgi:hypothetical protein